MLDPLARILGGRPQFRVVPLDHETRQQETCQPATLRSVMVRFRREIRQLVDSHPIQNHVFFEVLNDPSAAKSLIPLWASQDIYVSRAFPQIIGRIVGALESPTAASVLTENLWEELGEGDTTQAHANLLGVLLASVQSEHTAAIEATEQTSKFIETHFELSDRCVLGSLGAFCYGNEYLSLGEFARIRAATEGAFPSASLAYFEANESQDWEHTRRAEEAIAALVSDPVDVEKVTAGCMASLTARYQFYDGVMGLYSQ